MEGKSRWAHKTYNEGYVVSLFFISKYTIHLNLMIVTFGRNVNQMSTNISQEVNMDFYHIFKKPVKIVP